MWVVKCDERKCLLHRFWTLFLIHGLGFFFMIVLGSVSVVLKTHLKKKRLIWCFLSYLQPSEGSCLDSVGRPICSPVTLPLPPQGAPCMMLVAGGYPCPWRTDWWHPQETLDFSWAAWECWNQTVEIGKWREGQADAFSIKESQEPVWKLTTKTQQQMACCGAWPA